MRIYIDKEGGFYIGRIYQDGKTFLYNFGGDKERIIQFCRKNSVQPIYIYKNYLWNTNLIKEILW